jgi:sugar (pentulose or hexulose) kinase
MDDSREPQSEKLFLGIDLGTSGVRSLAVTESGALAASASVSFDAADIACLEDRHEQSPEMWWAAICQATQATIGKLATEDRQQLTAVAVDGTSGTLVAVEKDGNPLRPALMYNDPRASWEAVALNSAAGDFCRKLGYQFNASFALTKIAWLRSQEPAVFDNAARFIHQADFIVERLTGEPAKTDYSNALKTGYDLIDECWPAWIDDYLDVVPRLPSVVAPGVAIGEVSRQAAELTGLPEGLPVVAGASDGTAAFLASGARWPGDYNTTLGTTLVFKGISSQICRHPDGLIYCHKLPGGWWLPGAAGNTGAEWIASMFSEADVHELDRSAADRMPTECLAYPLVRTGERFPFLAPNAQGFFSSDSLSRTDRYAACLQGVGLLERLAYSILDTTIVASGGEVFSTGGGSRSDIWMQCRANATGRVIHRPVCGESAFGSAVLAAAGSRYNSIREAIERMVRIERSFEPDQRQVSRYDQLFDRFCDALRMRGYL